MHFISFSQRKREELYVLEEHIRPVLGFGLPAIPDLEALCCDPKLHFEIRRRTKMSRKKPRSYHCITMTAHKVISKEGGYTDGKPYNLMALYISPL
jgi:hypothetical protein